MIFSTLIFANVREFSFQPGRSKPRKNSNICYTLTANSINSFSASKSGKPVLVFWGGGGCGWVTLKIFNRIKKSGSDPVEKIRIHHTVFNDRQTGPEGWNLHDYRDPPVPSSNTDRMYKLYYVTKFHNLFKFLLVCFLTFWRFCYSG